LFFLYLLAICFRPDSVRSQSSQSEPNQDSINYYLQIVEAGEKQVGRALASIGYLYQRSGKYNSALRYFDQAIPLLNGEHKSLEIARVYRAKGMIYEYFGDHGEREKNYRLAGISYLRSAEMIEDLEDGTLAMALNQHLGDIAAKRGNLNRAIIYQNRVIKSLTNLYQDSLQRQAESFNDLLKKEIQSSKDTVFIESQDTTEVTTEPIHWSNWRHLLLAILIIALLLVGFMWLSQFRALKEVNHELQKSRDDRKQLERENEELQTLNLQLTKTEKAQRQASITKDKIFSIISHDLRSPINTIAGFLNILGAKMSSVGDIELRRLATEVTESTERLTSFLDDLLKWSMSQLGQLQPDIKRVDIRKIVQENYALVKPQLKSKNIHFKASVPSDIEVYADNNMLRLILRNLISNAIKFTRKDGYIAVVLKKLKDGRPVLEVSDDGVGMSEEKLRHLFDFKGSGINGSSSQKGAGLGLVLCKEFAQLLGGDITAKSVPGEGTSFKVYLPAEPPQVQPATPH